MPFPKAVARANRYVTNPLMRLWAGRLPPWAIVVHRGRRSGRTYRTPVWTFSTGTGWVVALTYGADSDWVKNLMAAGGGTLERSRRTIAVTEPRVLGPAGRSLVPAAVRPVLSLLGVDDYLVLRER